MNAINRAVSSLFNLLLTPLELLGAEGSIVVVGCVFTVVMLLIFKRISSQKGIKGVKDKIKGNMIAIRLYQDDLLIVGKAVVSVVLRNFQYLTLNFAPFIPLSIPFALVAAQLVVRYGFEPIPLVQDQAQIDNWMPGKGTLIEITLKDGDKAKVKDITLNFPPELHVVQGPHRSVADGTIHAEVVAVAAGSSEIEILLGEERVGSKMISTGDSRERMMQPERVSSPLWAILWPAEDTFASDSPVEKVVFTYPDRSLKWLMDGPGGVLISFILISFIFGFAMIKPLKIQI